jgi:murein DD-endopeptidase MepM/ murein hydrolase activator NlpD
LTRATRIALSAALIGSLGLTAQAKTFDLEPFFGFAFARAAQTVTLEPQSEQSPSTVRIFLTVRPGDSLASIANRFDTTPRAIKLENGLTKDALQPGITLKVKLESQVKSAVARAARLPPGASWHTVRRFETLSEIYSDYGITQDDLVNANPGLRSLDQIRPGERLIIPGDTQGAYVKLKAGDDLLSVSANHGVELEALIVANEVRDLRGLQEGDYLVLPGVDADATAKRLQARRDAEAAVRAQALYDLAVKRKAQARAELAQAQSARAQFRNVQRSQTTRVRRASANYSFSRYGGGYIWPMRGVITSGYGRRGFWIGNSNFHTGIDISAGYGAPIYAAHSGYVQQAGYGFFGLNVWIDVGGGVQNIYGHMSRLAVYAGSYVQRGQIIGYEGCSGICTGPHLHFEVRVGGQHVNPLRYLP